MKLFVLLIHMNKIFCGIAFFLVISLNHVCVDSRPIARSHSSDSAAHRASRELIEGSASIDNIEEATRLTEDKFWETAIEDMKPTTEEEKYIGGIFAQELFNLWAAKMVDPWIKASPDNADRENIERAVNETYTLLAENKDHLNSNTAPRDKNESPTDFFEEAEVQVIRSELSNEEVDDTEGSGSSDPDTLRLVVWVNFPRIVWGPYTKSYNVLMNQTDSFKPAVELDEVLLYAVEMVMLQIVQEPDKPLRMCVTDDTLQCKTLMHPALLEESYDKDGQSSTSIIVETPGEEDADLKVKVLSATLEEPRLELWDEPNNELQMSNNEPQIKAEITQPLATPEVLTLSETDDENAISADTSTLTLYESQKQPEQALLIDKSASRTEKRDSMSFPTAVHIVLEVSEEL